MGKPPMMRADLEHIINCMPETHYDKPRNASLMIFGVQAGILLLPSLYFVLLFH